MPRTAKPSNLKGKTKHGRSKAAVRKAYKKWYAKNKEDIISANVKRNGDRERLKRKGKVKRVKTYTTLEKTVTVRLKLFPDAVIGQWVDV